MVVWLVQGRWYRDEASKIIGVFATKKAASAEVERLERTKGTVWSYVVSRIRVKN